MVAARGPAEADGETPECHSQEQPGRSALPECAQSF
jgi:hypothetical protein